MLATPAMADDSPPVKPLEVGIVPYLSARVLVTSYEPMRHYLEKALHRPVKIYTAAGFKQFFLNAQHGDYDLILSAAHFARILQKDNQYTPVARFAAVNHALIVTALNSPIKSIQDLRGQTIAVPDRLSLSSVVVLSYLRDAGLQPDIDLHLLEVPSFASAIFSLQKGHATAAISAPGILTQMPKELSKSVKTLNDAGEFLRLVILTHPRIGKKYADRIKQALFKFGSESTEGKQFLTRTGAGAIIPVTAKDMESLDQYIFETKRLIKETHE